MANNERVSLIAAMVISNRYAYLKGKNINFRELNLVKDVYKLLPITTNEYINVFLFQWMN